MISLGLFPTCQISAAWLWIYLVIGKTEVNGDANFRMPQLAQAITRLLKQLKIKHCCLVGYSMGGRLALYLAIYFPQYFSGVIFGICLTRITNSARARSPKCFKISS